jgi:hypothetical protein
MNWRYFVGACILSAGVLLKVGAPLGAVAMGVALVALINWRTTAR